MMIIVIGFFIPEVKNRAMIRLFHACLLSFKYSNQFWVLSKLWVTYKTNTAFIRTSSHIFRATTQSIYICANSKIPSIHQ